MHLFSQFETSNLAEFGTDWRGQFHNPPLLTIFPKNHQEIQQIIQIAINNNLNIVPQGGNTSHVGGSVPTKNDASKTVIISLKNMNQLLKIGTGFLQAQAGMTLTEAQHHAHATEQMLGIRLAPKECTLGGNVATNAGGLNVIKYGMTRSQVLGLSAVLGTGEYIGQSQNRLLKDNRWVDFKQLLIGSEGLLGLITEVNLKLYPIPKQIWVSWFDFDNLSEVMNFQQFIHQEFYSLCSAFELMSPDALDVISRNCPDFKLNVNHKYAVLVELSLSDFMVGQMQNTNDETGNSSSIFTKIFTQKGFIPSTPFYEKQLHQEQFSQIWLQRSGLARWQKKEGLNLKHDISIPIDSWEHFLIETQEKLSLEFKNQNQLKFLYFGHLGDGNLHYNLNYPDLQNPENQSLNERLSHIVYEQTRKYNGSFSAEHGVGQLKKHLFLQEQNEMSLSRLKAIKNLCDPHQILNQGKVL